MAYSIAKVVTAIAILQLVERGLLALDQPLSQSYSAHPYGSGVTLRMLLAHTSGVRNPMPLDWFAVEGEALDRDVLLRKALTGSARLSSNPGVRYGYTNLGYWLLDKVVEAASGCDFARYVEQNVFEPLGIGANEARFELPPRAELATGHSRRFTPMNVGFRLLTPSRYWLHPHRGWSRIAPLRPHGRAYGGLFASADALSRVVQDLMRESPRCLSRRMCDEMFAEQRTSDGKATGATLGWVVGQLEGVRYVGKQGGGLGFHGNVRISASIGLATVLLANATEITPGPIDARSDAVDLGFVRAAGAV